MTRKRAGNRLTSAERKQPNRERRDRMLIVCEGKATEPNYFHGLLAFHSIRSSVVDVHVVGTGRNTLGLVTFAQEVYKASRKTGEPFDEVWCVFDCDSFPADDFDNAIAKCESLPHFSVAWSNESFELWFLLHLQDLQTSPVRGGHGRAQEYYIEQLDDLLALLGVTKYSKSAPDMYALLLPHRSLAASRAAKLLAKCDPATPCHEQKPATTIPLLVTRLLRYAPENQPS